MTRSKWLDVLQLDNISPLLDECPSKESAYEIFHAMAAFHGAFIQQTWERFGMFPGFRSSPPERVTRTARPDAAAALAALESLGVTVMSMETLTSDAGQQKLEKLLGE